MSFINNTKKKILDSSDMYNYYKEGYAEYKSKYEKLVKEETDIKSVDNEEIYSKIVNCGKRNEKVILEMMVLASNWDYEKISKVKEAFENMDKDYSKWQAYKEEYSDFFIELKRLWDLSEVKDM